MLMRNLSSDFVNALQNCSWWNNICADRELQPEIRDNKITVYFAGAALIRDLHFSKGKFLADIHHKYIPVSSPEDSRYVSIVAQNEGIIFNDSVQPLILGNCNRDVLVEYKWKIWYLSGDEQKTLFDIVINNNNQIIDQEIEFLLPEESSHDEINMCHYDSFLNCLALVVVKRIHDFRFKPNIKGNRSRF